MSQTHQKALKVISVISASRYDSFPFGIELRDYDDTVVETFWYDDATKRDAFFEKLLDSPEYLAEVIAKYRK